MNAAQAREIAMDMRLKAVDVLFEASKLDTSVYVCECCKTERYRNWPQKQLHDQMIGAAERLNNISHTLERRADDPQFIEGLGT